MDETIRLLQALIDTPSPTGQEQEVLCLLEDHLKGKGFEVKRQPVQEGRFNLLATTGKRPDVLLCTHADTVLPHLPFSRRGDVLRGRGACDAKGILAAMVQAGEVLKRDGVEKFGLLFVVGEEKDSDGARTAAQTALGSRYVIVGEPTQNRLACAQKGTLVFRVQVEGREGHSALPEQGDSAVHRLARLLTLWLETDWGEDPLLGPTTLNIGRVGGGTAPNVIAGQAWAEGIFRVTSPLEKVRQILYSSEEARVRILELSASEPQRLKVLNGYETVVVCFGSDAPYLTPLGEVLLVGPGSIECAHSPEEQITVQELAEGIRVYVDLVKRLLTDPD